MPSSLLSIAPNRVRTKEEQAMTHFATSTGVVSDSLSKLSFSYQKTKKVAEKHSQYPRFIAVRDCRRAISNPSYITTLVVTL